MGGEKSGEKSKIRHELERTYGDCCWWMMVPKQAHLGRFLTSTGFGVCANPKFCDESVKPESDW